MAISKSIKMKYAGCNTRDIILDMSNEFINEVGVSNFRVDTVASLIGFSLGNITYHFRRREDILNGIFSLAVSNVQSTYKCYMSSVLDIKQLYVLIRALAKENLKYIGVIAYKLGDLSSVSKVDCDSAFYRESLYQEYVFMIKHLVNNGCLHGEEIERYMELTFNTQLTLFFWWLNDKLNGGDVYVGDIVDRFALAVIHPLTPFMTESGLKQFEDINRI